ncbi:MAG: hypothetical protein P8104_09255, partial [Gammaproteobacteria bacterium]
TDNRLIHTGHSPDGCRGITHCHVHFSMVVLHSLVVHLVAAPPIVERRLVLTNLFPCGYSGHSTFP